MEKLGWYIIKTHGSEFQSGLPDLLCWHPDYGFRMIETKTEVGHLTQAQMITFRQIQKHGGRIYILRGVEDYELLFGKPNFTQYLMLGGKMFERPMK